MEHHHELINGILKSLIRLKPETGKMRNVTFSPESGVTTSTASDGGLSAESSFNQEGLLPRGTDSGRSPTIQRGFLHRRSEGTNTMVGSGSNGGDSGGDGDLSSGGRSGSTRGGSEKSSDGSRHLQDLRVGMEKILQLEEHVDRLESSQSGNADDVVVLDGNIVLRSKQDVLEMLEEFLGVNCDIPAGAFASPHFSFNKMMTTLGCSLPNLDEIVKLKRLGVKAIDLRNSQALMAVLPLFFMSVKLSTHIYGSGSTGRF